MFRFSTLKINTPQLPKFKSKSQILESFIKHFHQQGEIFKMPLNNNSKSMMYFSLYCRTLAIVYNQQNKSDSEIPVSQFRFLKKTIRNYLFNVQQNQRMHRFTSLSFLNFCKFFMKYHLQGDQQDISIQLNRYLQKVAKQPSIFKPNQNKNISQMIKSYRDFLVLKAIDMPISPRQKQIPLKIRKIPQKDEILFNRTARFTGVLNKIKIKQLLMTYSISISKLYEKEIIKNLQITHPNRIAFDMNFNGCLQKIRIISTEILSIPQQMKNEEKEIFFFEQFAKLKQQLSKGFDSIFIQSIQQKKEDQAFLQLNFQQQQNLQNFLNRFQYKSLGLIYRNLQKDMDIESSLIFNLQKYCKKAYICKLDTKQHINRLLSSNISLPSLRNQFIYLKTLNFHYRLYELAISDESQNYIKCPAELDDYLYIGQTYKNKETSIYMPVKTSAQQILQKISNSNHCTFCILVDSNNTYNFFKHLVSSINKKIEEKPQILNNTSLQLMNRHAIYSIIYSRKYSNQQIKHLYPEFQIQRYNKIYRTYEKLMYDPVIQISKL